MKLLSKSSGKKENMESLSTACFRVLIVVQLGHVAEADPEQLMNQIIVFQGIITSFIFILHILNTDHGKEPSTFYV